ANTLLLLGYGLERSGELPLAVQVLRQAQRRCPNDLFTNSVLGQYLLLVEPAEPGEALRFFQAALTLRPHSPLVRNNIGLALYPPRRGGLAAAESESRQAPRLRPELAWARRHLGLTLRDQYRYAEAEAQYRHAIRLLPRAATCLGCLGEILAFQGKLADAEK